MTIRGVLAEAWREIVELDTPMLRTAVHLSYKPHAVAHAFVAGDRRRYVNPVKFCLLSGSALALLLGWWGVDLSALMSGGGEAGRVSGEQQQQLVSAVAFVQTYIHLFNIGGLPVLAAALAVLFRRSGFNVAEQLSMTMFVYGEMLLFQALTLPFGGYGSREALLAHTLFVFAWSIWAIVRFERAPVVSGVLRAICATLLLIVSVQLTTGLAVVLFVRLAGG